MNHKYKSLHDRNIPEAAGNAATKQTEWTRWILFPSTLNVIKHIEINSSSSQRFIIFLFHGFTQWSHQSICHRNWNEWRVEEEKNITLVRKSKHFHVYEFIKWFCRISCRLSVSRVFNLRDERNKVSPASANEIKLREASCFKMLEY